MKPKVLVVEDEYLVREFAVDALTMAGFRVLNAAGGEQALAHCRDDMPDLLFTDVRLAGEIDGWTVAEKCRQCHPRLAVVYTTAFPYADERAVPGSLLFPKPYTPDELVSVVRALTGPASK